MTFLNSKISRVKMDPTSKTSSALVGVEPRWWCKHDYYFIRRVMSMFTTPTDVDTKWLAGGFESGALFTWEDFILFKG